MSTGELTGDDSSARDGRTILTSEDLNRIRDTDGIPLNRSEKAVVIADDQGRYIGATPAALALLGFALAELCTRSVADLTAPDQQDLYDETWASFQHSGDEYGLYTVMTGSGEAVPVRYRATANVMPGIHLSQLERL